ncbi:MAG: tetratricopeptide repeat protein [Ignavibacteriae bacterium]|nr:tetratricopeptide repeat protein [Ignavibacteriota bacterium]
MAKSRAKKKVAPAGTARKKSVHRSGSSILRSINVEEFTRRLRADVHSERRFALFLGAGCSVTSGIPAAAQLVRDHWLPRLRDLKAPHRADLEQWAKEEIPEYDSTKPGSSYGAVIDKLFLTPEDRQREIENWCDGRTPSFGYAVLAQLVAQSGGRFNVVLTTNFDDLVSDALYLYTEARPLVISHESLAGFIRPTRMRPLVVKLHGDHRLSPQNTALEIADLKKGISRSTAMVLHDRGLIFMGYGGADAGILKMLNDLPPEALPFGSYWVHPYEPQGAVRAWLVARGGIWVRSGWFDDVMLLVRNELALPHPNRGRFTRIFDEYHTRFQEVSKSIEKKSMDESGVQALRKAVREIEDQFTDYWKVIVEADRLENHDPEAADMVYREGIEQFPHAAPLLANYALFLDNSRNDYDNAELMFKRALDADPYSAVILNNYAVFIKNRRGDLDSAERLYLRALDADPTYISALFNYATFLHEVRKDYTAAEGMYKRALDADPKHTDNLGNYAVFLEIIKRDFEGAEKMFQRAFEADPSDPTILGNYAIFLQNIRKDYIRAEELYNKVRAINPTDVNIASNHAGLLLALGRTDGLEKLAEAVKLLDSTDKPVVELECSFYRYAHGPVADQLTALRDIRTLIDKGVRSPGWDLSRNVERAIQDGHTEAPWLGKLAAVINGDAAEDVLADWPAWNEAA